jgi:hypothetical protein
VTAEATCAPVATEGAEAELFPNNIPEGKVTPPLPVFARTNAVVAIFVELSPFVGVGAVGVPVNAGDALGAKEDKAIPLS